MTRKAHLQGRVEAAREMFDWLAEQRSHAKRDLDDANSKHSTLYEVGEFYDRLKADAKTRFDTVNGLTISAEKFWRKLKHELDEYVPKLLTAQYGDWASDDEATCHLAYMPESGREKPWILTLRDPADRVTVFDFQTFAEGLESAKIAGRSFKRERGVKYLYTGKYK